MTVHPSPKNLAREIVRQAWPKRQPRRPKPNRNGFPPYVRALIEARSGGVCELDGCGPAQVMHHRGPRSLGGTREGWVNRAANALHLRERCHGKVEQYRQRSYVNGWLVSRSGDRIAMDVPLMYRGRWVLLADDGQVKPIEGVS